MEQTNWCIYALFINDEEQIERNCVLKTINRTTNLAYSLDGYLWAIRALATEKLQIRCVMETCVITINPPLQIVDIGNGCKAYSASIYIPAKSELTTMLQLVTQSQFFLDYNFNYTNMSNFLIWHKTNFATLTTDEIKALKAKMLKLKEKIPTLDFCCPYYQNKHHHKILKMLLPLSLFLDNHNLHLMNLYCHLYWYQNYK